MFDRTKKMLSQTADLVFPPRCAGCGGFHAPGTRGFCEACSHAVFPIESPRCWKCSLPREILPGRPSGGVDELCGTCATTRRYFERTEAVWEYDGAVSDALKALKYGKNLAILPDLARFMRPAADQLLSELSGVELRITAVPMHPADLRRRGFNPAALLARQLFDDRVERPIRKTERRPRQTELDRVDRLRNLRRAYAVSKDFDTTGTWLVVDDVMTTGATMTAISRALRRSGADRVFGLVAARAC